MKRWLLLAALLGAAQVALAQHFSAGTNLADYAQYGTLNAEASMAVARRWSLHAGAKYNPFLYHRRDGLPLTSRQQVYAVGARFWPWNVYSGWWLSARRFAPLKKLGLRRKSANRNCTKRAQATFI